PAVAVLAPDFIIFVQFIILLQSTLSSYDIFFSNTGTHSESSLYLSEFAVSSRSPFPDRAEKWVFRQVAWGK
ncbi:hypothetical protein COCVIDRAFT_84606, partial [Bipolaris victoriae FI3]